VSSISSGMRRLMKHAGCELDVSDSCPPICAARPRYTSGAHHIIIAAGRQSGQARVVERRSRVTLRGLPGRPRPAKPSRSNSPPLNCSLVSSWTSGRRRPNAALHATARPSGRGLSTANSLDCARTALSGIFHGSEAKRSRARPG